MGKGEGGEREKSKKRNLKSNAELGYIPRVAAKGKGRKVNLVINTP